MKMLDPLEVRAAFPALQMQVYGKPVIYLDAAATSLKPIRVIDAISDYYSTINSNVHRGNYRFSQLSSDAFDQVRNQVKKFIHAESREEIIFTSGTTGSINLVANGLYDHLVQGDEILISEMEHHSNMIPWQQLARSTGAVLKLAPVSKDGTLDIEEFERLLNPKTKILALTHVSNVLGTINPVRKLTALAHQYGCMVLIDGAQGIVHGDVNVKEMDCDFYCFSAHKMFGPMGIGILYGKKDVLDQLKPMNFGGGMVDHVDTDHSTFKSLPQRLEAGTPNVSGVIGLGAAIDFLDGIGWESIQSKEKELFTYLSGRLNDLGFVRIFGNSAEKVPIFALHIDGVHAYDLGTLLDKFGIACRTGYHCTQVLHDKAGLSGTLRASLSFYNTIEEMDIFVDALVKTRAMLS